MAERKFDYDAVKGVYDGMKGINEQIKTLLIESDTEVKSKVSVVDEALYGDLGTQMLLNWKNISSNFPNFIDNFENWAALVAKASGNYQQFEKDVAGFKEDNPYGAASEGIKASYVSSSDYNNTLSAEQIVELDAQLRIYEETGATYIDTGMVAFNKKNKIYKAVSLGLDAIGIIGSAVGLVKVAKSGISFVKGPIGAGRLTVHQTLKGQAKMGAKGLTGLKYTTKYAGTYATLLLKGGKTSSKIAKGFWSSIGAAAKGATVWGAVGAGSHVVSSIVDFIGSDYNANKYMTGSEGYLSAGQGIMIDEQDYCFIGATPSGQKLLTDPNGKIYYIDSNQNVVPVSVTDSNGQSSDVTLENMEEDFTMTLGNEVITQDTTLISYVKEENNDVVNTGHLMDSVYSGEYGSGE